jgi:hypothetical protein
MSTFIESPIWFYKLKTFINGRFLNVMGTGDGVGSAFICFDLSPKGDKRLCSRYTLNCVNCLVHAVLQPQSASSADFPSLSYRPPHLIDVISPNYNIEPYLAQSVLIHYILYTLNSTLVVRFYSHRYSAPVLL